MRSFCVIFFFIIVACDSNQLVRQNAFFAPEFKSSIYNLFESPCGFTFLRNSIARIETVDECNFNIIYNDLNAEIFLTTINLNSNFQEVNQIFDEKIYENSSNAIEVKVSEYTDSKISVYSRMFNYVGNTPSNVQFYLTDSVSNFLAGSLFFKTEPNYDSLLPYINYINADLKKLIESFEWNK